MTPLGAGDVRRIADLARLRVSDEEAEALTQEFASIVGYLERLSAVDTTGVAPFVHVRTPERDVLREDAPVPGLDRAAALAEAPGPTDDGSFGVPQVLGTDE